MSDLFGQTKTIKAISLWQPWASLMAAGVKRHETRHWTTACRGPIAIHASKRLDVAGSPDTLCQAAFGRCWTKDLPLGVIVALGELAVIRRAEAAADHLTRADLTAGNFAHGRFAWTIDKMRRLSSPIPAVGRQGLFNWELPGDIEHDLGPVIDHGAACRLIGWA